MTTIAYHQESKTVAWDSRSSKNNIIATDKSQKMKEVNGVIFWLSGPLSDFQKFIDIYFGAACDEFQPECNALILDKNALYFSGVTEKGELWKEPVDIDYAVGSGSNFALAAMDLGKSATEAVEYAKTRDSNTGGSVHSYKISDK